MQVCQLPMPIVANRSAGAGAGTIVAGGAIFELKDYREVTNAMRGALAG